MKRANLLLILLLTIYVSSKAQETVTLTFTANIQGGAYCPFNEVSITNIRRGWTETLAYPDTVLMLNSTMGVDEQNETTFHLGDAYPNPFTDETSVLLEMPVSGEVLIQVYRVDGTEVIASQYYLEAGSQRIKVSLSTPSMALLVATSKQERKIVRILCTKSSGKDSITVEPVSKENTHSNKLMRDNMSGEFQPGDLMRYTAVLFDNTNTINSNTITQELYESQIVIFSFELSLPEIITNQITNITQTTAIGGGDITASGGNSVIARGVCWSTNQNPTINDTHTTDGTGTGSFTSVISGLNENTVYYVRAYATNHVGTSYGEQKVFVTEQMDGKLPGLFSVSSSQQIHFSRGNLQYQASTNTWRFAEEQWNYVGGTGEYGLQYGNVSGSSNDSISPTYSGWIDLFGWGTSGYNHGAVCYQPWSVSEDESDYEAYGNYTYNLYDGTGQADWGYNAISNGGNQENCGWRTLTREEWEYLFITRNTPSGIRYAKANVNDVGGIILLPDDWNSDYYNLNSPNTAYAYFESNVISASQWTTLEQHGAVFLPVTGYRYGSECHSFDVAYYWSSTKLGHGGAWGVFFYYSHFTLNNSFGIEGGSSVRLVNSVNGKINKSK